MTILKNLTGLCAIVSLCIGMTISTTTAADQPPNLIVIMADDLGAHELGCYGHPAHRTPRLDAMARSGVMFRTCYSTPICHPTRFQIMTGQYPHHNGVYQFAGRPGGPKTAEEDDISLRLTFAQPLKKAGYVTCQVGKWQLSGQHPTLIRECGFDEYCMWAYKHNLPEGAEHVGAWENNQGKTARYWEPSIVANGKYRKPAVGDYGPDIFADFAIDFIERNRKKPFFVYFPMALTHSPYWPTPDNLRPGMEKHKSSKTNWQANVEYTDKIVGRIVDALEELGLRENTIVMFTGDNGTGGNGKGQTTEMGCRVPMIVDGPGIVKPGGVRDELVDLSDIFPTLMEYADAKLPKDHIIDGQSFAWILRGEEGTAREWIYGCLGGRRVVRTPRWLLENNSPKQFGRLLDCGDCRDGSSYKDITESDDPEVLAAKKMMQEILADKAVPDVNAKVKGKNVKVRMKK